MGIDDDLIHLRVWGTEVIHPLPRPPFDRWTIGSGESVTVRLANHEGLVSREHCRLSFENGRWVVHDLGSTNGTYVDDSLRAVSLLEPGSEIRIGFGSIGVTPTTPMRIPGNR